MNAYRSLLSLASHAAAETPGSYTCLTERHIQALWLEQKYFKNLKTSTGLPIKVLSPGIWNADAGPDFLKAHLEIGGTTVKGDVEIHLAERSWVEHNHHLDPLYNDVVFHLSLWNPRKPAELKTAENDSFYRASLESFLTVSPNRLLSIIDLELYPYKKFLGSGKCSQALFSHLSLDKTAALFADAAEWRLSQKLRRLRSHTANPRLWMGLGIAQALGYRKNTDIFSQLYLWFHGKEIAEEEIFPICLQACGYFEEDYDKKWGECAFYSDLKKKASSLSAPASLRINNLKSRPFNHPVRRLAYFAKLVADPTHFTLSERLFDLWEEYKKTSKNTISSTKLLKLFLDMLPSYSDAFFNSHFIFASASQKEHLPLIGQHLKLTILVNTFFPLLAEKIASQHNAMERLAFNQFYASLSAEKTSKTKYLTHRFFGDTIKGNLFNRADLEQGAYQIHNDFCIHHEASCQGCPFVQRYLDHYNSSV